MKFLIIPVFILGIIICLMVSVFISQWQNSSDNLDAKNLEEWTCPECSFSVQLGTECPYCYTKKTG